ncbi:MAG TPA: ABC transporter permease subunit, partial [Candidatus Limnocylindrales bacterium]|nr:ABC transporter permease subunit [Candidatus Limnocylindrales bacterium]
LDAMAVLSRVRALAGVLGAILGILLLLGMTVLTLIGLSEPAKWSQDVYVAGFFHGTEHITQPPFPLLSSMDVFTIDVQSGGTHFYILGSDGGGRDTLALMARAVPTSLELVAAVVAVRLLIGMVAGFAMASGVRVVRTLTDGMGRWISGFPYLMLAIILTEALTPGSRFWAFVVGMAAIGWRDIARTVADQIEHVRAEPFALGARALGTTGVRFFRLHVVPYLRPALAIEIPFQASAVLVLLAELGYLGVFLGGTTTLVEDTGPTFTLANQAELGQLLASARHYIEIHQLLPVVVPAVAIAIAALAFELLGVAIRGRHPYTGPA